MDTAKRRVTESNQRAGLACRGETTRHVKLLLRFVEVLRIRRPASPADQESRPCFVSFCLLRHRDLHRLSSERESCFNLALSGIPVQAVSTVQACPLYDASVQHR